MKKRDEFQEMLQMFSDDCGYGDSDARKNAEQRLQVLLVKEQQKTANSLYWLTVILMIASILNVVIFAFQVFWKK